MLKEQAPVLTEEMIRDEINQAKKEDSTLLKYLNNFYLNFPGSKRRELIEAAGMMDDVPSGEEYSNFSPLYRSKTYGENFQAIDKALEDSDMNLEEVKNLIQSHEISTEEIRGICNVIGIPAYVALRLQGYNHSPDLTA